MEKRDMNRLVAKARAEQIQRGTELEEMMRLWTVAEGQRVERLKVLIASWYEAMVAAEYPGMSVLSFGQTRQIKKGLFFSTTELYEEEVAGWPVGGHVELLDDRLGSSKYYSWSINLLADGRLVGGNSPITPYRLGSDFNIETSDRGASVRGSQIRIDENSIPDNLKAIAKKVGLDWNPDEVMPNA